MWLVKKRENKGDRQKKRSRDRVGGGCKRHVAINKYIHRRLGGGGKGRGVYTRMQGCCRDYVMDQGVLGSEASCLLSSAIFSWSMA